MTAVLLVIEQSKVVVCWQCWDSYFKTLRVTLTSYSQ